MVAEQTSIIQEADWGRDIALSLDGILPNKTRTRMTMAQPVFTVPTWLDCWPAKARLSLASHLGRTW